MRLSITELISGIFNDSRSVMEVIFLLIDTSITLLYMINCNECERRRPWSILRCLHNVYLQRVGGKYSSPVSVAQYCVQDSNWVSPT